MKEAISKRKTYSDLECTIDAMYVMRGMEVVDISDYRFVPDDISSVEFRCGKILKYKDTEDGDSVKYVDYMTSYGVHIAWLIDHYAQLGYIVYSGGCLDLTPFIDTGKLRISYIDGEFYEAELEVDPVAPIRKDSAREEYDRRRAGLYEESVSL